MRIRGKWRYLVLSGIVLAAMGVTGCGSSSGDPPLPPPTPPTAVAENCIGCHGEGEISGVEQHFELAQQLTYDAQITSIDVVGGADEATVEVTIAFTVTDPATDQGVPGLTDDFEYTIAKWIPGDGRNAGRWQSYLNRSRAGTDEGADVLRAAGERNPAEDLGGGNYAYTFVTNFGSEGVPTFLYFGAPDIDGAAAGIGDDGELTSPVALALLETLDLSWEGDLIHRIAISSRADAAVYRFNAVADFIPEDGAILDELVNWAATTESCNACHATTLPGSQMSLPNVHGDRRFEVALCVTCHNVNTFDRSVSTDEAWVAIDLTTMIHRIHLGDEGYIVDGRDYSGLPYPQTLTGVGGVLNCRACHDNQLMEQPEDRTAESAALWQEPSVQGCGACHPTVLGVPIAQHFGDTPCITCHAPGAALGAELSHVTNFSTPNNPLIPDGAAVLTYEIAEVTVNEANQPIVRFRVLADEEPLDLTAAQPIQERITFSGTNPNFKITWSDPVGAVQTPVDWTNTGGESRTYFDASENLGQTVADQPVTVGLAAIVESLEGPDADGWFTTVAGINPAAPLAFPADANMRAVFMEGFFTFVNLENAQISGESVIVGVNGEETPRRQIVDINSCNRCHERVRFHGGGGRDNNPDHCVACHNPSMTSSNLVMQTSNNFKDMIHAIHAGDPIGGEGMRETPYMFIRGPETGGQPFQGLHDFSHVGYPSRLADCRTCHLEGTYLLPLPANILASTYEHDLGDPQQSLKTSPVSAACASCHDGTEARDHMVQFGGRFLVPQDEIQLRTEPPPTEPPVEEPPVEEPPVDEPPVDEPPVDEPPVDEPPVDEPPVDEPIDGQALYTGAGCAACHGPAGAGVATFPNIQNATLGALRSIQAAGGAHAPIAGWSDPEAQAVVEFLAP